MAALNNSICCDLERKASSYFVVKCRSLESLQQCIATGVWAFRQRAKPPQPQDVLDNAHSKPDSKVILVFSVNNQHGWHGYCESLYPLKPAKNYFDQDLNDAKTVNSNVTNWCHFTVKWIKHFQSLNSNECLPFQKTKDLVLLDSSCVNIARNWQEVSLEVGKAMCELIDQHFTSVNDRKRGQELEKVELIRAKESFFNDEESALRFSEDISAGWKSVIEKVERELGTVLLACPFGSQRYNCSIPGSDSDILVIYQAKTVDILGLDKPPQTIKNSHSARMDYTILELQRYCELLIAGDPRYVETLFIEEESILAFASPLWKLLCDQRHILLTQDCLDKYLREAKGTKGIKQFEKWKNEIKDSTGNPPAKMNKLAYIIMRLLQSGRDMVKHGYINVYRLENSQEREELLSSRLGHYSISEMQGLFAKYIDEIESLRSNATFNDPDVAKTKIQQWLVEARLDNLGISIDATSPSCYAGLTT